MKDTQTTEGTTVLSGVSNDLMPTKTESVALVVNSVLCIVAVLKISPDPVARALSVIVITVFGGTVPRFHVKGEVLIGAGVALR